MTNRIDHIETVESLDPAAARAAAPVYCLSVALHPDMARVGDFAELRDLRERGRESLSRLSPLFSPPGADRGAPLADTRLSRQPVWLSAGARGSIVVAPEDHGGSVSVAGVRLAGPRELTAEELAVGVVIELARTVVLVLRSREEPPPAEKPGPLVGTLGHSEAVLRLKRAIAAVGPLATPVLIRGETGAGKELAAQAIHAVSGRRSAPFVSINMASLPPTTAASELFGHALGAFTGAVRPHEGYFEQAHGGTLLLDEVAAAPHDVQAMLLRVLEEGSVRPVGGRAPKRIDVRVIAATDEALERAMAEGRFREPLYHRLASYTLLVPPLRERREDIGPLFVHFLREALAQIDSGQPAGDAAPAPPLVTSAEMVELLEYRWPGNVRELRNVARELVVRHRSGDSSALCLDGSRDPSPMASQPTPTQDVRRVRRRPRPDIDEADLRRILEKNGWRVAEAAAQLGVSRSVIYDIMGKSGGLRTASALTAEQVRQSLDAAGGDIEAAARELKVSPRALRLRLRALGIR